ncbi:Golgi-specific brefeldin A-resistance guanine nucleotide exchange factor 1 isoform X1 [Oncorhynchus mykiss]|uniref:Golgi-specific brefeldin A-resistance guanine nucleotide exchange factor 1 isoform X1 n=2 Tax=Oncorhynchus mykiss TaxID=8022 RepID=UPI0018784110|nr:Golgi-specific brefeldin A-resistance guanine nucleotide exchange factor 1 isoform X1 [Oncorhynchus mykiss]XP_036839724.1 Golgi-specific brefeldin A-resistance guanine nucleotide exchange factor 1 isoform X1 [Oncorhynchus mykiss]XP_036839729.1 Golgi-specific brefeldin A-resistance guanine nucleotide exchange factor 1 isoform X1 [Oncorhynchus mykiss]
MVDKNIYIVQGEIITVVSAIKRNSRWNTHTPLDEEQDPLLNSFSHLKETLNNIKELSDVEPNVFLRPFLEVVRSEDTTGPITGLALTSVNKFLSYGLIDANHEAAAEAIENMADAVTHARFVGTDPASDEVVLMKILQVLRTLLLTPVGAHLTNESVCEIMQSCFRICFEVRLSELLRKSAEHTLVDMVQLLFSRLPQFKEEAKSFVGANMKKIPSCILDTQDLICAEQPINTNQRGLERLKMRAGGMSESSKWKKQKRSPRPPHHMVRSASGGLEQAPPATLSNNNLTGGDLFIEQVSLSVPDSMASSMSSPTDSGLDTCSKATSREDLTDLDQSSSVATTPGTATSPSTEPGRLDAQSEGRQVDRAQSASVESIPEVLEDRESVTEQSDSASIHDMDYVNPRGVRFTPQQTQRDGEDGAALIPYSLPCLRELFRFLISLTNPHDRHNTDAMMHMGLQLLTVALEAAHIAPYQSLLGLVKDELCRHLFQLLNVDRMNLCTASIRACFLLFESMRGHLKFQLEMYLKKLMDIITSENMKMPYEMKEMALEALVQLWRIPSFVTELYINHDCDFYCSNLFEDLTKLLSKNAFPVSGQLYTTHLLSLEALLTVIDSTEAHCQAKVLNNTAQQDQSAETVLVEGEGSTNDHVDTTTEAGRQVNRANGQNVPEADSVPLPPTSGHLMAEKMRLGRQDQEETEPPAEKKEPTKPQRFSSCLPDSQELLDIRNKKKLLNSGTEQFNQKPKKGIQFLQEKGLLSSPMDNNEVAQWLRENPRLDKKQIGEFISDRKHMELLDSFVNTFTFQGLRIDEALRLYLEAFRLPGEAPVIHRLLETFTDTWHKVNGSPFMTNDAGFALAYAVIMLNTDQHNNNVRKQNIPMTVEQFKKNLKGVNGNTDFDQDMLEDIYNAIKNDEIVMPDEQSGLVKENYVWSVLLHRGATSEGVFLHVPAGSYDHDLFTMTWGPTIAALSYVFDKSLDDAIIQKAIAGFRKCAMISAHCGFSDVFDNLIISLCKFTTLSSESAENLPTVFGSNGKAQVAAKTVFHLAHRHGDILREGWKNIMDSMLQLFRAELLPKAMVEVEDFVEPNGKISLQREETPSNRGESAVLSFVNWLTLSGAEQSGLRGPSTENQEAKQAAMLCIKQCDPEKLITESKFLQLESLQELMKALISVTPDEETYDEEDAAFCLEMLLRIVMENRDRVSCVWQTVRDHLCHLCVQATESCFLVERAVVGLIRLAIRLLRREDISSQVLLSLRLLLMMKPHVLARVSREVAYGLHELLKTNAANIHCTDDWFTLFSLIECIGAGIKPPASFQVTSTSPDIDTGAQSDSELSHHHSEVSLDRGYTSDSEVYTEHGKSRMPRSVTDVDVASSGWLVVGKDDLDINKVPASGSKPLLNPLVNQYSLTLGQDMGFHDTKSLIKCVESLSFIVRDAAHVTPENFELCVKAIRVFVEASLNGGYRTHEKKKNHKYDSQKSRVRRKPREKEGASRRAKASSQRPSRSHSDDEEDEGVPASYHTVSLQVSQDLLDLMHTLHTRAASIYSSWAQEQRHLEVAGKKIEADSQTLWTSCWCPLLQGIAWLCCDARRQVRMQALTYLQRALLVHDLQTLDAVEWESCFNKVLFPLLTKLLDNISPADVGGMEETRMRACTLLSKVFLQHLSPLLSLPTFAALWLTILDFMDKYMHAGSSDLLLEAIPESLKNMLLVMDTAGIFHSVDSRTGYSDLWEITWERINCFLPNLREELFKQTVIPQPDPAPSPPVELAQLVAPSPPASPPPAQAPSPVPEPKTFSRPASPQDPPPPSANGTDRSSPVPPSTPPMPTPVKMSPQISTPLSHSHMSQSPLILQPLASHLQVGGVPPMSLPIILNPALIEASSPVPLLPAPRPTDLSDTPEVK